MNQQTQATKPAPLSFSGTPRPIRRPGGPRRRSGAALQIRTSRASTGVHAASPPREAHPTLTTSPGTVRGSLAAASGALVVEYRPPARPSSERVRKGSRTGPAAVPWTQKLAPAEHSRLDPRPWPPRRAPGPPQERRQRRWCSATTPSRRSRIWRATGRRSPAPEDEDGRNGPGRALGGSVSVSIL